MVLFKDLSAVKMLILNRDLTLDKYGYDSPRLVARSPVRPGKGVRS